MGKKESQGDLKEKESLRCIFDRFDSNGDGSLTHLELAALLRSLGLEPRSGDQIHSLLASMDLNDNGSVEFEELAAAIGPMVIGENEIAAQSRLWEVFKSFDRDGNGFISAAELARSMAIVGQPLTFLELTEMMREADADGDGVISFREFAAVMSRSAANFLGLPAAASRPSSSSW